MTTYIVTGVDTGIPSLPNDSVIHGLHVGQTFTATLDSGVEAELIAAGLIAKSPVSSPVSVAADGSLVAADGRTLPVVSVASGTPTNGQFASFNGDGNKVVPVAAPSGGGASWTVVEKAAGVVDAVDGDFIIFTGQATNPGGVTTDSPTLTGSGFTSNLINGPVDDQWNDEYIPIGTTVLSVESGSSLTMSANATGTDAADVVAFGLIVNLPAPVDGSQIAVRRDASAYNVGHDGLGGPLTLVPSSGTTPMPTIPLQHDCVVLIADGTNWQLLSRTPPVEIVMPRSVPLPGSLLTAIDADHAQFEQFSITAEGSPPLYGFGVEGQPIFWSNSANESTGGLVSDAIIALLVEYHSSSDAGDILATPPVQTLFASFIGAQRLGGFQGGNSATLGLFGYVDHIPADGHAAPRLTYQGVIGGSPFNVLLLGTYGVIRLDGSASCVVSTVDAPPHLPTDLDGGHYNADSTLMNWAGASIKGTDLTADGTNNWIHSTAGGLVYVFSTLQVVPALDDFAPFS